MAPLKELTIPRLELCAVELGSKLLPKIKLMQIFHKSQSFMRTDSEIVLYWLRKASNELKVFVANRVVRILSAVEVEQCRHIRSEENPADLLSRGTHVSSLLNHSLWWNGPPMLEQSCDSWPKWQAKPDSSTIEIVGSETVRPSLYFDNVLLTTTVEGGQMIELINRWSSYQKTCRITAYVFRFCSQLYSPLRTG